MSGDAAALARRATELAERACRLEAMGRPALAELAIPLPRVPLHALAGRIAGPCWAASIDGVERWGAGCALGQSAAGPGRWRELAAFAAQPVVVREGAGARWLAAFGFADRPAAGDWEGWPAAMLWWPELWVERGPDGARASVSAVARPGGAVAELAERLLAAAARAASWSEGALPAGWPAADVSWTPDSDEAAEERRYRESVAVVLRHIEAGELAKVVLARRVVRPCALGPGELFRRVATRAGAAASYLVSLDGQRFLVGATPERLVSLRGGQLEALALAGTAPRGATRREDRGLASELLDSTKERHEHELVVGAIAGVLRGWADEVQVEPAPSLLALGHVMHLATRIAGRARAGVRLLELAGELHPTPAIGGWPREPALERIRALESAERGLYAGAVGELDETGQGELWVTLRCGLLDPAARRIALFGGAGIVSGSDPTRELAETQLKLRALEELLGAPAPALEVGR